MLNKPVRWPAAGRRGQNRLEARGLGRHGLGLQATASGLAARGSRRPSPRGAGRRGPRSRAATHQRPGAPVDRLAAPPSGTRRWPVRRAEPAGPARPGPVIRRSRGRPPLHRPGRVRRRSGRRAPRVDTRGEPEGSFPPGAMVCRKGSAPATGPDRASIEPRSSLGPPPRRAPESPCNGIIQQDPPGSRNPSRSPAPRRNASI